jgi:O-antigen/teichoic acid export membrane protein
LTDTIATLGLEKYALRYLPGLLERGDAAEVASYWRFSLRTAIGASLALIVLFALGIGLSMWTTDADPRFVILYLVAFLPGIGVCLLMLEMVTAGGAALPAAAVYRFVLPATLLSLILVLWLTPLPLGTATALIAFGAAWTVAALLLWRMARARLPVVPSGATGDARPREWLGRSVPFLLNSMLMTLLAQSGIVILAFVSETDAVVGRYAVAAQIGTFIVLLATSTNRLYLPRISVFIERRDRDGMLALARERLLLIGGISAVYLLAILAFGRSLLRVFGDEFVGAYPALCWIAAGAVVSTVFAVAPYYLQFMGRNGLVLGTTAAAVAVSVVLCLLLGRRFGTLGAAVAYAAPLGVLFVTLRVLGMRHLRSHWSPWGTA